MPNIFISFCTYNLSNFNNSGSFFLCILNQNTKFLPGFLFDQPIRKILDVKMLKIK